MWIHYGFLAHTTLCVVIAAGEGLMARETAVVVPITVEAAKLHSATSFAQDRVLR
jgi:hypothetical protein